MFNLWQHHTLVSNLKRRLGSYFSNRHFGGTVQVMPPLTTNGLVPYPDFPSLAYESIHRKVRDRWSTTPVHEHFSGAWNALGYRFHGAVEAGEVFQQSLSKYGAYPAPAERFQQEQALFSFFSGGFSAFESLFYGMFAIGAFVDSANFSLATPRDQQSVTPAQTERSYKKAFPGDPIMAVLGRLFADPDYQQWREIRNVLTHRTAPGRLISVGIGDDDAFPVEWKLNNISLDADLIPDRQRALARLIGETLSGVDLFLDQRA